MQDLIVLCADRDARLGVQAILTRSSHFGVRKLGFRVVKHANRDNGVFQDAHNFLRPECTEFAHAIAICDLEGCGREGTHSREQIAALIEQRLQANGWAGRAAAIVIAPELEAWIWGDWDALSQKLNWPGGAAALRAWLIGRDLIETGERKPSRPKEVLEKVRRQQNLAASSGLFAAVGRSADVSACVDPAFSKLINNLRVWFPL